MMKYVSWLLVLVPMVLISCNEDGLNESGFVAGETFTNSNIRVVFTDTMTVEVSTIKFDSIITSEASRILVGKYKDPVFGIVKSAGYFELQPLTYSIATEAEYDSIALLLKYDNYYYNDTTVSNTLHIRRLTERLRPHDGSDFYNTSNIASDTTDLAVFSYYPRPLEGDTLEIKLADDFGKELFEQLQGKLIVNSDEFTEHLKGLAIQPGAADNGAVVGFAFRSGESFMRLYYSVSDEDEQVQDYMDFEINTAQDPIPFFNRITAEMPNEYLELLTDNEISLNSSVAGNQSFIQAGVGIATKIQFPHIKSIYNLPGKGTLLDAVLKIKPAPGSYDKHLLLRESINVFLGDRNNEISGQLTVTTDIPLSGTLNRENEEFNNIYYEISIGSYIEGLLTAERDTDISLILIPDDYSATTDRIVLNGPTGKEFSTSLELTYAIYNEDE